MFDLPKIYQLIPADADDADPFPIRGSEEATLAAARLNLPPALVSAIARELRERERQNDLEEFFLGAAMLCLDAAMNAGAALLEEDEDACDLSLLGHAPDAALAIVSCGRAAPRVRDALRRAVDGARLLQAA